MAEVLPPSQASPAGDPLIKLDQFLKLTGVVPTGGRAKQLIQAGQVWVNGEVETRRGRKLRLGDEVAVAGQVWQVRWDGKMVQSSAREGGGGKPKEPNKA